MLQVHEENVFFKCQYCEKKYKSKGELRKHMAKHTGIRNNPSKCDICEKTYSESSYQKQHIRTVHSSDRPFTCGQCRKTFKSKSDLTSHMLIHEDRKHECHICGQKFHRVSKRNHHYRSQHKQIESVFKTIFYYTYAISKCRWIYIVVIPSFKVIMSL